MRRDVELSCRCGEIRGQVRGVGPDSVNRAICYCGDCQAFVQYLERGDLLDAQGGSDIVQVAPSSVTFESGQQRIRGLRLTTQGMYRWYAACCRTPLGNTVTPAIPFIGLGMEALRGAPAELRDEIFGKVRGAVYGKYAIGGAPEGSTGLHLGLIARSMRLVLGWKLGGKSWPHPYFDLATRAPIHPVTTLAAEEREALRAKCGPHRAAARGASLVP